MEDSVRNLLNTLYLNTPDRYLRREGETIVIEEADKHIAQIPVHNMEGLVLFGPATITPALIALCNERNIHISFLSPTGRFLTRIQSPISGNVKLRRSQYRKADYNSKSLEVAQNFCLGKLFNCRNVLQRLVRDHETVIEMTAVNRVIGQLRYSIGKIGDASDYRMLLGIEGEATKNYYSVFNELIINKESGFVFHGRSRRPPMDEVNGLLSFFYTLLAHEVEAALETVGLDPQVGFYHQERPGRAALALDMMEELRPYMVDRFVLSLINNRQVKLSDFERRENGATLISKDVRSILVQKWQERKQDVVTHPYLKEKIEVGLIPYSQALLMARFIRDDLDGYPPFLMR